MTARQSATACWQTRSQRGPHRGRGFGAREVSELVPESASNSRHLISVHMLHDLVHAEEIVQATEHLLQRADAAGCWPTPVDALVRTAELEEQQQGPLSESWLRRAPKHLQAAVEIIRLRKVRAVLDRREHIVHLDPSIDHEGQTLVHPPARSLSPHLRLAAGSGIRRRRPDALSWYASYLRTRSQPGAAELLFQGTRFGKMAAEYRIGMGAVSELADIVGASLQATLRQYVETHRGSVCGLVLDPSPAQAPLTYRRREVTQSAAWTKRFGVGWPSTLSADVFPFLMAIDGRGSEPTYTWPDVDNEQVAIKAEALCNRYAILILLWSPQREIQPERTLLRAA